MNYRALSIVLVWASVLCIAAKCRAEGDSSLVSLQEGETAEQFKVRVELEEHVRAHPEDKVFRTRLIGVYASLPERPWEQIERLIGDGRAQPEQARDPYWRELESSMWLLRDRPNRAVTAIREALKIAQEGGDKAVTAQVFREYLSTLAKTRRFNELLGAADDAFTRDERAAEAPAFLTMRAVAKAGLGKRDLARADFDAALALAEQKSTASVVDEVLQSMADTLSPEAAITSAMKLTSASTPHRLTMLGYLQLRARYNTAAEKTVAALLGRRDLIGAERTMAYGLAGSVFMQIGRYVDAVNVYRELLEIEPNDTVALNNLACLMTDYIEPAQPVQGLRYSRKMMRLTVELGAPIASHLDTHGWALVANGRTDAGIAYLNAAAAQMDSAETRCHLGLARLKQGRKDDARIQLDKARRMMESDKASGKPIEERLENHIKAAIEGLER